MSNIKRWKKRSSGEYMRWEEVGQQLEGIYLGMQEGTQSGFLGKVQTEQGLTVVFSVPSGLKNQLEGVKEGRLIQIHYRGYKLNQRTKREYKSFDLYEAVEEGEEKMESVGVDEENDPWEKTPRI